MEISCGELINRLLPHHQMTREFFPERWRHAYEQTVSETWRLEEISKLVIEKASNDERYSKDYVYLLNLYFEQLRLCRSYYVSYKYEKEREAREEREMSKSGYRGWKHFGD